MRQFISTTRLTLMFCSAAVADLRDKVADSTLGIDKNRRRADQGA